MSQEAPDDLPDSSTLPPGTTVGAFEIVAVLGKGGMSSVYQAYEAHLGRVVALKVLPPEFLHDDSFALRFQREALVVAMLEHRHIVPIYDSGIDAGIPWMSMRLLNGGTLSARIEKGAIDARETTHLLRGVAEAVDYAHARGVIHRDIKPSNILLDQNGHVCVGDFGVARLMERSLSMTRTGTITGTPQYMAPEQALGKEIDHHSDIYSLGIVAYEMLTGETPFEADAPLAILMKQVNDPIPVPSRDLVPEAVFRVLQKALAKAPDDRWPTATAFVAALEASIDAPRSLSAWTRMAAGATAVAAAVALALVLPFMDPARLELPAIPAPAVARDVSSAAPLAPPVAKLLPATPQQRVVADPTSASTQTPLSASSIRIEPSTPPESTPPPADTDASPAKGPPGPGLDPAPPTAVDRPVAVLPPAPTPPDTADVVTQPVRIHSVLPVYPPVVQAMKIEGNVVVEAVVGPDGNVLSVAVKRSLHRLLDESAKTAVLQYKYTPALRNGTPFTSTVPVTVVFALK